MSFRDMNVTLNLTDSVVHNYNNTILVIDNTDSVINTYNLTEVLFVDDANTPVSISGRYKNSVQDVSFTLKQNITDWILTTNGTDVITTFEFDTEYKYFNESVVFLSSPIVLKRTFIPLWNYSLNNSHMMDFRNYSLLENIFSLTNVRLSRSNVNVTLIDSVNLTSRNLESDFIVGSNFMSFWFNVSVDDSRFNITFPLSFADNFSVSYNGDDISADNFSVDGMFLSGSNLSAGYYRFLDTSPKDRVVLGEFWVTLSGGKYFIGGKNSFFSFRKLNGLYNFFSGELLYDLEKTGENYNIFYYSGNLFNNNEIKEIIN